MKRSIINALNERGLAGFGGKTVSLKVTKN